MNKKILIVLSLLIFVSCSACVCASEVNETVTGSSDDSLVVENTDNPIADDEVLPEIDTLSFDDLQHQINEAPEGSVLDLNNDYQGASETKIYLNKDLTIDGHGHTLDCNAKGCYVFFSNSGNIILKNLNIINSHNDKSKGGAVFITGSAQYIIENCKFLNNWAKGAGGAIYNNVNKNLTIINSIFDDNSNGLYSGGAIYSKGEIFIQNSSLKNNRAFLSGGAVYCENNVNVCNSVFENNRASGSSDQCYGGAISSKRNANVENSTFKNNYADDYGGAIHAKMININANQDIDNFNSFFIGNTADDNDGGALYGEDEITLKNTVLSGNHAKDDGGAIYTNKFANDLYNVAFSDNNAGKSGGAIYINKENHITFKKCNFTNNHCNDEGGAIYTDSSKSHLSLIDNIFDNNNAVDGKTVFNCGYYDKICQNYWAGNIPSSDNHQLVEWKATIFQSNVNHVDSNPKSSLLN